MARRTAKIAEERVRKMKNAKVPFKQLKAKVPDGVNPYESFTAKGRPSQEYDTETKQFTKAASSTKNGLMSVEGSNNTKGAKTWTFTDRDMDGNLIRQSGRSQLSDRRQRNYDVRNGLNNISPKVIEAWEKSGMLIRVKEGYANGLGNIIRQKPDGTYSMGLTTG